MQQKPQTFADVLKAKGITEEAFTASCAGLSPDEVGYCKYKLIAEVLNEGWTPDWTNSSEYKYQPWMIYSAGSGFAFIGVDYDYARSLVGSRLCFKSRDLAKYAATQFADVINEFFL